MKNNVLLARCNDKENPEKFIVHSLIVAFAPVVAVDLRSSIMTIQEGAG